MIPLAALVLLAVAPDEPIEFSEYRAGLKRIEAAVEGGDLETVRAEAERLRRARVRHEGGELRGDETVLGPLADAKDRASAQVASVRLRVLLTELEETPSDDRPRPADGALLERLRREEAETRISTDGQVGGPALHAPKSIPAFLRDLLKDLGKLIERFLRWLGRLLFQSPAPGVPGGGVRWMVVGLIALVLAALGVVAILALRRSRGLAPAAATSEAPAPSARDEDPLSRSASEWERFAAELMGAGRFREAIRAWYHAVLVSLFRAGALHYRKDRTNWEYAYALPSTLPWRPGFVQATRTFEQEWYGRRDTPAETAEIYQRQAQSMLADVRQGAAR